MFVGDELVGNVGPIPVFGSSLLDSTFPSFSVNREARKIQCTENTHVVDRTKLALMKTAVDAISPGYSSLIDKPLRKVYPAILQDMHLERERVRELGIFKNSKWMHTYKGCFDTPSASQRLRFSLLSNGSVFMNMAVAALSLRELSYDITRGVVTTLNEIATSSEGIRVFFEFDYRGLALPSLQDIIVHIDMACQLVHEMFPKHSNIIAQVAACKPKTKMKKNTRILAMGIHMVFPTVVTTSQVIKIMADTLNSRISIAFPKYVGIVDSSPVNRETASLRCVFSYKIDDCSICFEKARKTRKKNTISPELKAFAQQQHQQLANKSFVNIDDMMVQDDSDAADEEENKQNDDDEDNDDDVVTGRAASEVPHDCDCGKLINPSVYRPLLTVLHSGDFCMEIQSKSIIVQLQQSMINPITTGQGNFTRGVVFPNDAVHPLDRTNRSSTSSTSIIKFKSEEKGLKKLTTNTAEVKPAKVMIQAFTSALRTISREYSQTRISSVRYNKSEGTVLLVLDGNGSRFCVIRNDDHTNNRVYAIYHLKSKKFRMYCHNKACSETLKSCRYKNTKTKLNIDPLLVKRIGEMTTNINRFLGSKIAIGLRNTK